MKINQVKLHMNYLPRINILPMCVIAHKQDNRSNYVNNPNSQNRLKAGENHTNQLEYN